MSYKENNRGGGQQCNKAQQNKTKQKGENEGRKKSKRKKN
jgi:hypothetical protein